MSDTKTSDDKTLSVNTKKTLTLKRPGKMVLGMGKGWLSVQDPLGLCGPEHLTFARGARKPFNGESHGLHGPTDTSFGGIGDQAALGFHGTEHFREQGLGPKFRLDPGPKGIKINEIEPILLCHLHKIHLQLGKKKGLRDLQTLAPRGRMHGLETIFKIITAQGPAIFQLHDLLHCDRKGLHPGIIDIQVQGRGFLKGNKGIESGTEAYFQDTDLPAIIPSKAVVYKDMVGLLDRPVPGMVLLVPVLDLYGLGPIGGLYDPTLQAYCPISTPSASKR